MRLRYKLLLPFIAVITALLAVTYWACNSIDQSHRKERQRELPRMLERLIQQELERKTAAHEQVIKVLQSNLLVQETWIEQDRDKLLAATRGLLQLLKPQGVTHFYFIKPDGECFLRVHLPEHSGDKINRITFERAAKEQKTASGLELGAFYSLSLRTVAPWRINGGLAGYIELSTGLQEILDGLQKLLPVRIFALLSKEFLEQRTWEEGMRSQNLAPEWELYDNWVLLESPASTWKNLIREYLEGKGRESGSVSDDTRIYEAGKVPVIDLREREVGAVLFFDDWTDAYRTHKMISSLALSLIVLIFLLLGAGAYLLLGRIEKKLLEGRRLLEAEISIRHQTERSLSESEQYLRTLSDTIDAGILVVEASSRRITDANRAAALMLGCRRDELIGKDCHDFMCMHDARLCDLPEPCLKKETRDQTLDVGAGRKVHMRRSYAEIKVKGSKYVVQSLSDITDLKALLNEQELNISLARRILGLINPLPRYVDLCADLALFVDYVCTPSRREGGDHFFIRTLPGGKGTSAKTLISLNDQSGHEVNCILRSIVTDLVHTRILSETPHLPLSETCTLLNDKLCKSGCFSGDDFLTAINAEIDHDSLVMKYVSAGHPGFLLIRGEEVLLLPELGAAGINLPLAARSGTKYTAGEVQLRKADKIIFYTDGLTEMRTKWNEAALSRQDMTEIIRIIIQHEEQAGVRQICRTLLAEVSQGRFRQGFALEDDLTLVGIDIEDANANSHQEILHVGSATEIDEAVERLSPRLSSEWQSRGFSIEDWKIQTVLEESLRNAWRHGNREDPGKAIVIRWKCQNEVQLEVIDEGDGFDSEKLPDPTSAQGVTALTGRGIFMMQRCVDSLRWKAGGRHLVVGFGDSQGYQKRKTSMETGRGDSAY